MDLSFFCAKFYTEKVFFARWLHINTRSLPNSVGRVGLITGRQIGNTTGQDLTKN